MSFQDVDRRRQHPIFDKHRKSLEDKLHVNGRMTREEATDRRDERRDARSQRPSSHSPKSSLDQRRSSHHRSSTKSREKSPTNATTTTTTTTNCDKNHHPKKYHSVRPRLSTSCPVTKRNLLSSLDDTVSVATTTTTATDLSEEDDTPPVVRRKDWSTRSRSIFATLTHEIVNFQKMVADLEILLEAAATSPEMQWKSRILIRSAQDADHDLGGKVYKLESTMLSSSSSSSPSSSASSKRAACRKLLRDYERIHNTLHRCLMAHAQRQRVDVSFLSSSTSKGGTPEEFFDRAMREREEEEVQQIQCSMNKVNAIYQDLAALVDSQQKQIDTLADNVEEAKSNTRSGLESIQYGFFGDLCGAIPERDSTLDNNMRNSPSTTTTANNNNKNYNKDEMGYGLPILEPFHQWTMASLETLGEEITAAQADVFRCGQSFVDDIHDTVQEKFVLKSTGCSPAWNCLENQNQQEQQEHRQRDSWQQRPQQQKHSQAVQSTRSPSFKRQ